MTNQPKDTKTEDSISSNKEVYEKTERSVEEWEKEFDEMWDILNFEVCTRDKSMNTQTLADYEEAQSDDIKEFIEKLLQTERQRCDEISMTYKRIAELLSATYYYGGFVAETPNEREIQKLLEEVNLWPTNENMVVKRSERHETLNQPNNPHKS